MRLMWGFQKKTTFIYLALPHRLYKYVTNTMNKERDVRLELTVVKPSARS